MKTTEIPEKYIWKYPKKVSSAWKQSIADEFNIHPVIAEVLVARNFDQLEDIYRFLYSKLPDLISPNLLLGMEKAVQRTIKALKLNEGILIFGDNDVDGITGTTLLVEFLKSIGGNVSYFISSKSASNQLLLTNALEFAIQKNCKLLITVDCGITAANEINDFLECSIDAIITDHHEPTHKIPRCIATLNPKLINSDYPNRDLTGVGVAFKLAHAITNTLVECGKISASQIDLKRFLDLVALGTVADMGALTNENRILVRYGLRQFAKTDRIGLLKLMENSGISPDKITTNDIAAKIAPRLNSLGRIADATIGVNLLLEESATEAQSLISKIEAINCERQRIEKLNSKKIDEYLTHHPEELNHKAIVLYSDQWHPGVIPIITARLSKKYNRPTVIIAIDSGVGKGSMRTISNYPLLALLGNQSHLLINYGGHDFAAGLTIKEDKIFEFKKNYIEQANKRLKNEDIQPKIQLDAPVEFNDISFDFLEALSLLEPFGTGNPLPLLYSKVTQLWPPKIIGSSHLKFFFKQNERVLEGIGFGMAHKKQALSKKNCKMLVAFTPQLNLHYSKASIQLLVRDCQIIS